MSGRLLVVVTLLFSPACGDDGANPTPDGAAAEAGPDAGSDGGVPFTLPTGGPGHANVGATLGAGQARAGRVTSASQLLSGMKAEGRVGDYKLYNDRVAFIIRDTTWSDGYAPFGAELLDAARVEQPGGESLLGETFISAGIRMLKPSSVGVVADGSDGKAAIVRTIGEPAELPVLAGLIGPGLGGDFQIHMVIDYVLEPDSSVLEIRYRAFNKLTTEQEVTLVGLGFSSGDGVEFYAEKVGFDAESATKTSWIGMFGDSLSYLWYSPEQPMVPLIIYEGLWIHENGSIKLPAAGEASRSYYLGLTDGEPEAALRLLRQLKKQAAPTKVAGKVLDGATPVSGARVHVQLDDGSGTYATMTHSAADGSYSVELEPGDYLISAVAKGYELTDPVKVTVASAAVSQDITMGGSAAIDYVVTDGTGTALPAKLIFKRATALKSAPASFGEQSFPAGATLIVFDEDGSGTAKLPPGSYTVTASRGFEYEIDSASVTVTAGQTGSAALQLVRSVDTTGYMCGDFHVHAMWSPDSSDLYEMKVAALAAEGVELPVITDHEYIADLTPFINKLGLTKWVQGVVGEELTTFVYGHFNPFPIEQDDSKPNKGAMTWYNKKPGQLFADVRKAWPNAVLQVNHPRASKMSGYFTFAGYDPVTGVASTSDWWSTNFDAIEAFNASGWSSNKDRAVLDWFSFLDRGLPVTVTGNSDSHHAYSHEVGYPRNYVKLSTDAPGQVSMAELGKSVKDGHVLVSGGPFVTVAAGGKGMGEVADATSKQVTLQVKVQAPTWMNVDTLRVILGGTEVHTVTLDASTADPTNPVVRYDNTLQVLPTQDTWVVVVVTGPGTLAPVSRGDEPFAVTNPIYLDVDGNGAYEPPKTF